MLGPLLKTKSDISSFILRVGLGAVMWPHGAQKALAMYGGLGIEDTVKLFEANWGIPPWQAYCVIAAEFLGAIGLLLGAFTRLAALAVLAVMAGAIHHVHGNSGFFVSNGGYEYVGFIAVVAFVVFIRGGGALSVDGMLAKRGMAKA